ncbi:MAG: LptF/LptG family permease [Alphaproteobacteria bacterium]
MVVEMAVFKLPQTGQKTMPFAILFGTMLCFWKLNRNSELVVMRAAGISVWQFLIPVLACAVLIAGIKVMAVNPAAAVMIGEFEKLEAKFLRGRASLMATTSNGVWLRQVDETGPVVIHAPSSKLSENRLELAPVTVLYYAGQDKFASRVDADRALLESGQWVLSNARINAVGKPPRVEKEFRIKTDLTIDRIQESFSSPSSVSFWDMPAFIGALDATGFSTLAHRLHYHSLLAEPLLYAAMVLVAAIFSLRHNRRSGALIAVAGGVVTGFVLFFLSDLVLALGYSTNLPTLLAAWTPACASTLLALAALMHLEDG